MCSRGLVCIRSPFACFSGDTTLIRIVHSVAIENPDAFSTGAGTGTSNGMVTELAPGEAQVVDIDPTTAISVNSAIAIEKEIAADTMGTIFAATESNFLPYLEQCTLELILCLEHYYEGIRKSSISSLFMFMQTFYELSSPKMWEPGANVVSYPFRLYELVVCCVSELFRCGRRSPCTRKSEILLIIVSLQSLICGARKMTSKHTQKMKEGKNSNAAVA